MEVLAARLKWLRDKYRYGQKEIASELGVTVSGYQKMEYGDAKPKLEVLVKIAQFYNVSTDFLLGLSDEIEKLKEGAHVIYKLKENIHLEKQYYNHTLMEEHDLQKRIQELEQRFGDDASDSINETKMSIDHIRNKRIEQEHVIYQLQQNMGAKIVSYIEELLTLPDCKPWNNKHLKNYYPLSVKIRMDLFNNHNVYITGNGFSGEYSTHETLEEAEKTKEELLSRLYEKR